MQRTSRAATAVCVLVAAGLLVGPPANAAPPVTSGLEAQFVADDVVPTVEGTVETWTERHSGVITATQPTAARRPELVAGALNGHAVARFDGADDGLTVSDNLFASASFPKTVFAVVRSSDDNGHVVGTGSSSTGYLSSYGSAVAILTSNYFYKANSGGSGVRMIAPETTLAGSWQVIAATLSAGGSRIETLCSVAESSDALNAYGYSATTIGSTGGGVDPLDGEIAELLVYDRVLDASEIAAVRSDLAQTYALSIPTRTDTDGDGFVDPCDQGLTYLKAPEISVTLVSPPALSGGTVDNAIDAADSVASDAHTTSSHVYYLGGPIELDIDLGDSYSLETLHFWNYTSESYDVDDVSISFRDEEGTEVATYAFSPVQGVSPIFAQDFALTGAYGVRTVEVTLTGSNDAVDFQNIGFSGRRASPVPALGGAAQILLVLAMACTALLGRRRSRFPARRT